MGSVGGVGHHLLQAVADVRRRRGGGQLVELFDPLQMVAQAIKPNLKFSL